MLRCPNCRAQNPGSVQCRRCGMELSALQNIEDNAKLLTLHALKLLIQENLHELDDARDLLMQACKLQHEPLTTLLLGFVSAYQVTSSPFVEESWNEDD